MCIRDRAVSDCTQKEIEKNVYHQSAVATGVGRSADALTALKEANKDTLTDDFISSLTSNIEKVNAFENAEDTLDSSDSASRASIAAAVKNAYAANGSAGVTTLTNTYASQITTCLLYTSRCV